MLQTDKLINVAPSSVEGHYIKGTKNVVSLDEVNETFLVEGKSELVTKNHTNLEIEEDCLITCQVVYDPWSKAADKFRKAKD